MQVTVSGIPINYLDVGEGRPLVVLHGRPTDHRAGAYHLEPLFDDRPGWRRLYPDLPGMGRTPGADWMQSQDDVLQVVLDFVDRVIPDQRFALTGMSYGGYLALGVVHHRPQQLEGVMLWATTTQLGGPRTVPERDVVVEDPVAIAAVAEGEETWLEVAAVQTVETLEAFRASIKPGIGLADLAFLRRLGQNDSFSFDVASLPPVGIPALILAARQDHLVGHADILGLLDTFPRATLAILDRAGHGLAEDQKPLFRMLVVEWLDRLGEALCGA